MGFLGEFKTMVIRLLMDKRQQTMALYMDDTFFTLLRQEDLAKNLVYILDAFYLATRLVLN